jgi:GT2 family glycosyltransferase
MVTTDAGCEATSSGSWPPYSTPVGPSVAVVICAYTDRRWPEITAAVDSVVTQRTPAEQVILVVDHNEPLLARARRAFPGLTVVPNSGPRGLSGARNTGVAYADRDVVAFLDDDAVAEPDWLTGLVAGYRDAAVLAVGGRVQPMWDGARPSWLPPEFDWVIGCSYTGQPTAPAPVRNLIGCNMSFRRAALDHTGGFDPGLGRIGRVPVGCEETELCIRLRAQHAGGVVWYEPGAVVRHRVTADRTTWSYFRRRCYAEGRSKAVVARLAGPGPALSAEREYTRRALPRAVRRELARGAAGWRRAAVIAAGLAVTGSGYVMARARGAKDATAGLARHRRALPPPVRVLNVEISEAVPAVTDRRPAGGRYAGAQVMVRLHGRPLAVLDIDLPHGGLTARAHAELIAQHLAGRIDEHLRRDGLPRRGLTASGLGGGTGCADRVGRGGPLVSVVVPTVGDEKALRRCLEALAALDYPRREVVVVDNAPGRSAAARIVSEWAVRDPHVRYASEPRRGVAHARNRGLTEARGEIVAFADDDVIVDRRWLRALVDGFADDGVAAVTGLVVAGELETPAQRWIERYGGYGKGCQRARFDRSGYDVEDDGGVRRIDASPRSLYPYLPGRYGSGANMAFRTERLRRLGGFDPRLGAGATVRAGEDIDALMRMVLSGQALVYEPAAVVWHSHRRDPRVVRRTVYAYGVGLTAVMTKALLGDAATRREVVCRLPRGLLYALRPGSAKNAKKRDGYPLALTIAELVGMALGPVQLVRATWAVHRSEVSR